jgi:nucleotide sugar dehydrogenase
MSSSPAPVADRRRPDTTAPVFAAPCRPAVAIVGLGYVGLPAALAFQRAGRRVIGIDVDAERLRAISARAVDLGDRDGDVLEQALAEDALQLTAEASAAADADVVVICVPTPVDAERRPDQGALRAACAGVVAHARPGQVIILSSTTYVGTTRELLVDPLRARSLEPGSDVAVAFAPERILPGAGLDHHRGVPRVVGGATPACTEAALAVLGPTLDELHPVSSLEAAELTKLFENSFRAVNLAFVNEIARVAGHYAVDPIELVDAAATKPYGFLSHHPGPGVGGHCIPVDPHWLLAPLDGAGVQLPVLRSAMVALDERPGEVASRVLRMLGAAGIAPECARALVVGVAYKGGLSDARESPGRAILERLAAAGCAIGYHDPLVPRIALGDRALTHDDRNDPSAYDIAVLATLHPGHDYRWLGEVPQILDGTYRWPDDRAGRV